MGAELWIEHLKKYVEMFYIVIGNHLKAKTKDDVNSQIAVFRKEKNIFLEDVTKKEATLIEYIRPDSNLLYLLAEMCYVDAINTLEQNSLDFTLFNINKFVYIYLKILDRQSSLNLFINAADYYNQAIKCLKY